jgi:hypothetical protein
MLPTKFWFIWPSSFRGEDLKKSTNQKQELPVAAMLLTTFFKVFLLAHLAKGNVNFCHHLASVVH